MRNKPPCELCIKYAARQGREPDCEACIPPLYEENELAVDIFLRVRRQLIFPPMGGKPLGLDLNPVLKLIEMAGGDMSTLDKILFLENRFIIEEQ